MPQLAALQGTSCTRDGSNADIAGTIQNVTVAPISVTVTAGTGTQTQEMASRTVTLNFGGGIQGVSVLPWQASVPANGATICFAIVKAVLNIP